MIFNNYMFEEHTLYNYEEVVNNFTSIPLAMGNMSNEMMKGIMNNCGAIGSINIGGTYGLIILNSYKLSYVPTTQTSYSSAEISPNALMIFYKLFARYKKHYAINVNKDENFEDKAKDFMMKLFNLLDYTFVKYDTLLSLYESQKSHLLDKLGRTRTGERELATNVSGNQTASGTSSGTTSQTGAETTSGTSASSSTKDTIDLHNDTPQTTDVVATIEGNQYVSDLRKIHESESESGQTSGTSNNTSQGSSSGQTSSTETSQTASTGTDEFTESEMWDTKTMMEKLDEIEKNFSNLIKKWLNEFDELFIEEVNY